MRKLLPKIIAIVVVVGCSVRRPPVSAQTEGEFEAAVAAASSSSTEGRSRPIGDPVGKFIADHPAARDLYLEVLRSKTHSSIESDRLQVKAAVRGLATQCGESDIDALRQLSVDQSIETSFRTLSVFCLTHCKSAPLGQVFAMAFSAEKVPRAKLEYVNAAVRTGNSALRAVLLQAASSEDDSNVKAQMFRGAKLLSHPAQCELATHLVGASENQWVCYYDCPGPVEQKVVRTELGTCDALVDISAP